MSGRQPRRTRPTREVALEARDHAASRWLATCGRDDIADLLPGLTLPATIDRELLVEVERNLQ